MAKAGATHLVRVQTLYALAFSSGFAALVYQVVWAKMLSLTFGSTTVATSAVVGGFMCGMGIGAWLYHRVHDRHQRALRLYGLLEVGIGISAALLTAGFLLLPELFARVASALPGDFAMTPVRITCVVLALLIPSALMGATYPALCTAVIDSRNAVDRHLGMVYGLNTLGAAAGAMAAGLVLIELLGLSRSAAAAVAINVSVGGAALLLALRSPEGAVAAPPISSEESIASELPHGVTATVLVCSGFATLSYEILWFRALRYLFGNSTYALSMMLVIFLLGLGLGGLLLRPIARRGLAGRALALSQIAIAVLALTAIALETLVLRDTTLFGGVSYFVVSTRPWWAQLALQCGVAVGMMLPAVLLMGLAFPLASRLYLGSVRRLGARVGTAYLLANVGSIVGAIVAAVVLLPKFGTIGGTRVIAGLNFALGLLVLAWIPLRARTRLTWAATGLIVLLCIDATLPRRLPFTGSGMDMVGPGRLLFEEEGDLATVQVRQHPKWRGMRAMTIDGVVIGVNGPWHQSIYLKQLVLAHLPMALDRSVRRTLNVGLGVGSTLHALAAYPQVETLEVVEISSAVVRGARLFPQARVLQDPRVVVIVEDVLHHLLRTDRRYDLIISDGKQNRTFHGNAKLLSWEFYEHARARLAPGGLFIQWIPVSSLREDYRVILRTFCGVFPQVEIFLFEGISSFMVGSNAPILGRERLPDQELPPTAKRELASINIENVVQLHESWVASRSQILEAVGPGPVNRWDRLVLEYTSYRAGTPDWEDAIGKNLSLLEYAHARTLAER